jgi:hypothetical protein
MKRQTWADTKFINASAAMAALVVAMNASGVHAQPYAFGGDLNGVSYLDLTVSSINNPTQTEISLSTYDQGSFSVGAVTGGEYTGYLVGNYQGSNYRDFFAFPVGNLSGTIVSSAALIVNAGQISNDLTFSIGDATPDANAADFRGSLFNVQSLSGYNDLSSGGFGTFSLTPSESYSDLTFTLNSSALSALNSTINGSSDQYFALSGNVIGAMGAAPETRGLGRC